MTTNEIRIRTQLHGQGPQGLDPVVWLGAGHPDLVTLGQASGKLALHYYYQSQSYYYF